MRARSQLEIKFLLIWKKIDGQKLEEEFRFHHVRKWRFDFAHTDSKVAIEIEGGIWGQSRHTKAVGYIKDCEKYNAAIFDWWDVVRLPNYWINPETLTNIKNLINRRCQLNTPSTGQVD